MAQDFLFLGGDRSLDLVNTTFHRAQPGGADELLTSGAQAQSWFVQAGLLSEVDAAQLDGDALLPSTLRLRNALDAIYRPLARCQDGAAATSRGLLTLNAVLGQGRQRCEIVSEGEGFARHAHFEVLGPPDPNVEVARRAADLLSRLEPRRLKECQHPDCDLLFYDESRNISRRWCTMDGCGNQQKQARHRRTARALQKGNEAAKMRN